MNKQYLKNIRDNMPEHLKYISAPLFRQSLIKNREFIRYSNLLVQRETLSTDQIKDYQFNQLKCTLIHSYKTVPYYTELFCKISFDPFRFSDFDEIKIIPYLTREIITDNFDKLISKEKIKNGYYSATTGGSTGSPLRFLLDYDSVFKENAFLYYYRKKLGYELNDRMATFRQIKFGVDLWQFNPMHNELIFFPIKLTKASIVDVTKKLNDFQPKYLNGYPSSIWYFAKLLNENNIKHHLNLKGIFLMSENIDEKQRAFIEEFFKVKSSVNYGHSERCVIGEGIGEDLYRFDPYYGFAEQIPNENGSYSIVGTGFLNSIMPFIRYKTDDVCIPEKQYYRIEGKRSSTIGLYGTNDEFIPSSTFDLSHPIFKNIILNQFIQSEKGKADLLIVVGSNFKMSELSSIKDFLSKKSKNIININVKIVETPVLSPRGKFESYISYVKKDS
jgi:phenylacetate-CoA ligase